MPNRVVRHTILDSTPVNTLSWPAEVFFRRLMSIVDDYGRFDARPSVLRAQLYPIKLNKVSESDVVKWMQETVEAGLIRCYTVKSKEYLEIYKFGQTLRIKKSKFPAPEDGEIICSQMQADASRRMSESESESEKNPNPTTESETRSEITPAKNHLFIKSLFYDLKNFEFELSKDDKYTVFDTGYYHETVKNWSANGNSKIDWMATAKNFMLRDLKDGKPKLKPEYIGKFNAQKGIKGNHSADELIESIRKVVA